jgi:tetratricopeptide (TPR) repeat protein
LKKNIIYLITLLLVPALVFGLLLATNKPLDPNAPETYFITGNAFYKTGDYYNAIEQYNQALVLNPTYEEALSNLAFSYNKLDDFEQAAAVLEKLVELRPENPSYHYDLAINLVLAVKQDSKGTIEDVEKAQDHFNKADELSPGFQRARENAFFLEDLKMQYYN